jgi:hypothetical protein
VQALSGDSLASYFARGNPAVAQAFWAELLRAAARASPSAPMFYVLGPDAAAVVLEHPGHTVRAPLSGCTVPTASVARCTLDLTRGRN